MNTLVGTGSLVRLVLRRERIQLPVWILVVSGIVAATASSFASLYPTVQSRQELAASIVNNPSILALSGPAQGLDTIGGMTEWKYGAVACVLVGLMAVFMTVRHTRADEETGRHELLGAGVVGRYAKLTATLIVVFGAGLAYALLIGFALTAQGLPAAGSFAMGLGIGGCVWFFSAVTAVAAQVSSSSRAANGIGGAVIGAAYLLRAAGDSAAEDGPRWLSWLSPIGWSQQMRPFAGERFWVLALFVVISVVLLGVGYALVGRRDIGAGLLPERAGRPSGVFGTFGLAWRLQRGILIGWTVGIVVLAGALGGISQSLKSILDSSPQVAQALQHLGGQQSLVDSFMAAILDVIGLAVSVYAIQAALRLRAEETAFRAEPVLAGSVARLRWAASHLAFALIGSAFLLAVAGTATGLAVGLTNGDVGTQLPRLLGAAMVQVPAVWVLAGIATALFGLLPRLTSLAWAALVVFLLLGQLGSLFQLSQWALDISPFTHLPKLPGGEFTVVPLIWLLVVTAALTLAGLAGFRRRDVG
ncbi:ABC transporter permease [Kutzneria sp. 744]|uniref:ABC transporter permease n=1 Tax=Kutzneria sp. (strain 744) TaxID=345341 RepID=UPI0003EED273|nr:ABC transporter permease [Kutzneria sp. 744]EWM13773.1 ABC transporter membrane-spanning protein [Kutzneria sp. 744]